MELIYIDKKNPLYQRVIRPKPKLYIAQEIADLLNIPADVVNQAANVLCIKHNQFGQWRPMGLGNFQFFYYPRAVKLLVEYFTDVGR